MNANDKQVKLAINSLNSFYKDIKLLIEEIKKIMKIRGFVLHPQQGNYITYANYALSNSILYPEQWIMKGMQFCLIPSEMLNGRLSNKAIFFSISLYQSSVFEIPVLMAWVTTYNKELTHKEIADEGWGAKEIWTIDTVDSLWRSNHKNEPNIKNPINLRIPIIKLIDHINILFFNLMSISDKKILEENVLLPILKLYNGESLDLSNNDLIVQNIPENLIDKWNEGFDIINDN